MVRVGISEAVLTPAKTYADCDRYSAHSFYKVGRPDDESIW